MDTWGNNARRTSRTLLTALLIVLVPASPAPPAEAVTVLAGACKLTITLGSDLVSKYLEDPTWTVSGSGLCATVPPDELPEPADIPDGILPYLSAHVVTTGSLNGTLTGVGATAGCAVGLLDGTLMFDPGAPGTALVTSELVIAVEAGLTLAVAMKRDTSFAGAGVFTQVTTDQTVACATVGSTGSTFEGVFLFGDPVL